MSLKFLALLLLLVSVEIFHAYPFEDSTEDEEFVERDVAMEFLKNNEAAIYKRLLYSANEQQVEVIERYEEKCKRSIVHSTRKRWCPKLSEWADWNAATAKNDKLNKLKKPTG